MIAEHDGKLLTLDESARQRHVHIVGGSGTGKSTLLKQIMAQHLAIPGQGVALIDPLGHVAQAVLGLVPPHRAHELMYIDAADLERPIGFNVLEHAHPDRHAVIADDIVSAFIHIWGETAVGDRSQQVLRNAIRALMATPSATLLAIPRLLTDEVYRARVVRAVRDPVVLSYWTQQFAQYDDKFRTQVIAPILNKLDTLLSAGALRNIVGQVKSSIDLRRTMDEGRILILNLRKALIGEGNAHVLGALIIAKLAQAAFAREDTPQHLRRPFYVLADEFQDYASSGFLRLLSQSRNYALGLTLSHQYCGQMSEAVRKATLANAATTIAFRVGADDAPLLAAHLGLETQIDFTGMGTHETAANALLTKLPNYQAYVRTLIDDTPTEALRAYMFPDAPIINHRPHRLITHSRMRFGRDRSAIEAKIARFLTS